MQKVTDALTTADIEDAVASLRGPEALWDDSSYLAPIDPIWLATPARRWALWSLIAGLCRR